MESILVVLRQTGVMFLMMVAGAALFRGGILTREGSAQLGKLLLNLILPCAIFNSFLSREQAPSPAVVGWSTVLCVAAVLLSMAVAILAFRKDPIANFSASFSNAGFMGIPLIQTILDPSAVIYVAPFIALLNVLQWTYGVYVLTGRRDVFALKKLACNPILISLAAGLLVLTTRLNLPKVFTGTVSAISAMNAPTAMLILGVYLAQTNVFSLFREARLYAVSAMRLLVIPVLTLLLLKVLPTPDPMICMSILIAASAPVGSNVVIYAQQNGMDHAYACKTVCLSTLISIVTMPAIVYLAERLSF